MKIIDENLNILLEDENETEETIEINPEKIEQAKAEVPETEEEKEETVYYNWIDIVLKNNKEGKVYDISNLSQAIEKQLVNNRFAKERAVMSKRGKESNRKSVKFQPSNMLIVGPPGGGKTGIIDAWVEDHVLQNDKIHINHVTGSQIVAELIRGVPANASYKDPDTGEMNWKYVFLQSNYFDDLEEPNSVLFLDEINTAPPAMTGALLTLMQDHRIGEKVFNNFLFTIAAMNPIEATETDPSGKKMGAVYGGANKLQMALLTRFKVFTWESNPKVTRDYLLDKFEREQANFKDRLEDPDDPNPISQEFYNYASKRIEGYSQIIDALIPAEEKLSPFHFKFADNNALIQGWEKQRPVLNARTLEMCLQDCDGTVEDFLNEFKGHCGDNPDVFKTVKSLLAGLEDSQKNANRVFGDYVSAFNAWKELYMKQNGR